MVDRTKESPPREYIWTRLTSSEGIALLLILAVAWTVSFVLSLAVPPQTTEAPTVGHVTVVEVAM